MIKRMMLLAGLALAAVAFAAPAAQADVWLSDSEGNLEAGAEVTATSENLVTTRPNDTQLECDSVTLHFELTDPGKEHLELEQQGEATTENCTLNREAVGESNLPVTIQDGTVGVGEGGILTIDTWGTGEANATFVSEIFLDEEHEMKVGECHFEGDVHVESQGETSDVLQVTPSTLVGTPLEQCGHGEIHGDFTMETPNGDPIQIHHEPTP